VFSYIARIFTGRSRATDQTSLLFPDGDMHGFALPALEQPGFLLDDQFRICG
jgi:hypothetical protein